MNKFDFKEIGIWELESKVFVNVEGGAVVPVTSVWWNAFVGYVKYCMETGGQNVTYHAQ